VPSGSPIRVLLAGAVAGRAGPAAAAGDVAPIAAPLSPAVAPAPEGAPVDADPPPAATPPGGVSAGTGGRRHAVVADDTLWRLAERYCGRGEAYERIVTANAGRVMSDGRTFTRAGVIIPGWGLEIPGEGSPPDAAEPAATYEVVRGDTLSGISGRFFGDPARWTEVFALNRGAARLADGRVLTNPDLIWPGLRPRLPAPADQPRPAGADPAPETPAVAAPEGAPAEAVERAALEQGGTDAPVPPDGPLEVPDGGPGASLEVDPAAGDAVPARGAEVVAPAASAPVPAARAGAGAAGAAAVLLTAAGVAVALRRRPRRVRRSLDEPPVPDPAPGDEAPTAGGYVEADLERVFAHRVRAGEAEPAVLVAEEVRRLLHGLGLDRVRIPAGAQGRSGAGLRVQLTIDGGPAVRAGMAPLAGVVQEHLGGACAIGPTPEGDAVLTLGGLKPARLLLLAGAAAAPASAAWVPLGVTPEGDTLSVDWRAMGHVLLAGAPGGGVLTALESLVAALASRCPPGALHLALAAAGGLSPAHRRLPHLAAVSATDDRSVDLGASDRDPAGTPVAHPTPAGASDSETIGWAYGELRRRMRLRQTWCSWSGKSRR
jgi:nucleoid-associated protein YgaU